jgi:hypothetical protein
MGQLAFVLAPMLLAAGVASAAAPHRCAEVADPAERLRCYDGQFPPEPASVDPSAPVPTDSHSANTAGGLPKTTTDRRPADTAAADSPELRNAEHTTPPDAEPHEEGSWLGGLFDWREPVRIESSIKAMHRRDTQNMVFLLDNEQIWLQDAPRALPFRRGDKVTITSGTIGGYFMTAQNGTRTRVRRIR